MAVYASSMSWSVPGSRSAVDRAAVVCSTQTLQRPSAKPCSEINLLTVLVRSMTCRFLAVRTLILCIDFQSSQGPFGAALSYNIRFAKQENQAAYGSPEQQNSGNRLRFRRRPHRLEPALSI